MMNRQSIDGAHVEHASTWSFPKGKVFRVKNLIIFRVEFQWQSFPFALPAEKTNRILKNLSYDSQSLGGVPTILFCVDFVVASVGTTYLRSWKFITECTVSDVWAKSQWQGFEEICLWSLATPGNLQLFQACKVFFFCAWALKLSN